MEKEREVAERSSGEVGSKWEHKYIIPKAGISVK